MEEEDYIISAYDNEEQKQNEPPAPDFRFLVITTSTEGNDVEVTTDNVDEFLMDSLDSMDAINNFFDSFDSKIAYPNEGHIKYEVGSDGLCVVIVDSDLVKKAVTEFIESFGAQRQDLGASGKQEEEEEDKSDDDNNRPTKKRK
ncbi:hypothetical protein DAMA08_048400 [Martiniozyma asiatica (nom. inval.)]|nr:hypothetical protein DAMA08_048400 [Martiniozyma asiatica]